MKRKSTVILSLVTFLTLGAFIAPTFAEDETPVPPGSIRVSHKIKKSGLPALAKIDLCDAVNAALAKEPGKAIEVELEVEDGTLVYSVLVLSDKNQLVEFEVDAGNGKVLVSEIEGAEDED